MKLHIKYMVSNRCIMATKEVLTDLGLHFFIVDLGEVEVMEELTATQREELRTALSRSGLELMDDTKALLVERIKKTIIQKVNDEDVLTKMSFSSFLSKELNHTYAYLATLFSEVQGITIEQFTIANKIERVKELMIYGGLNMTAIAWKLNYSSVAHLSSQFKKATGFSPSYFKKLNEKRTIPVGETVIN